MLEQSITDEIILKAIDNIKGGKAAGLDGLLVDSYKQFKDKLVNPLKEMFKESFTNGYLPPTLSCALIILILKPDKCPTQCDSYRPISLLNTDTKIIAKLLALRLEKCLSLLINADQSGFIKNFKASHNIRRVLNIIQANKEALDTVSSHWILKRCSIG